MAKIVMRIKSKNDNNAFATAKVGGGSTPKRSGRRSKAGKTIITPAIKTSGTPKIQYGNKPKGQRHGHRP